MGDFVLPKDPTLPLVFIAVGVGFTPFASIISDLIHRDERRAIQLLRFERESKLAPFKQLCDTYSFESYTIIGGTASIQEVQKRVDIGPNTRIFIAGPEKIVERLSKDLISNGLDDSQVVTDFFHGY